MYFQPKYMITISQNQGNKTFLDFILEYTHLHAQMETLGGYWALGYFRKRTFYLSESISALIAQGSPSLFFFDT